MDERRSESGRGAPEPGWSADLSRLFDERGIVAGCVAGIVVLLVDKILLLDKVMEGLPFYDRVLVLAGIVGFAVVTGRTYGNLAGIDPGAPEAARRRFDVFRQGLIEGGTPAKTYNRWLGRILDAVDRFFGDAGRTDRSWFARRIGLETPGPRWTAIAYDRCLLLALVYPIVVVFGVWVISGHAGQAETALGLRESMSGWTFDTAKRWAALASAVAMIFSQIGLSWAERCASVYWMVTFAGVGTGALIVVFAAAVTGAGTGDFRVVFPVVMALTLPVVVVSAFTDASTGLGPIAIAYVFASSINVIGIFDDVSLVSFIDVSIGAFSATFLFAVIRLVQMSDERERLGLFLVGFSASASAIVLAAPLALARFPRWHGSGALLLFFGLFALINAPIDWAALGFTRALLRKGLQKSGWWPFAFALVDLVVAAGLVALLAIALVFAVQVFDDVVVLGGGAQILPLHPLFTELHDDPGAYENWWVWAMLFSSMFPSFVNLILAGAAFLRGLPLVHSRILARLQPGLPLPPMQRLGISAVLAGQTAVGAVLGLAVLVFAAEVLLPVVLPAYASVLLSFADSLERANLPAQLLSLIVVR